MANGQVKATIAGNGNGHRPERTSGDDTDEVVVVKAAVVEAAVVEAAS
jgi:hypothetical protein